VPARAQPARIAIAAQVAPIIGKTVAEVFVGVDTPSASSWGLVIIRLPAWS
jgi:hypothetical protein